MKVFGKNVFNELKDNIKSIKKVYIAKNFNDKEIIKFIQDNKISYSVTDPKNMDGMVEGRHQGIIAVIDECFIEFLPQWRGCTAKQLTAENKNLIVLDAFTKTYSLAGFRLGFCVSGNRDLLEKMAVCGQSFGVSTPAQFAGVCALQDDAYMEEAYKVLLPEREWLFQELKKLPLTVYPSQGNFLLLWSSVENIREKLLEKGIKVRDCSQFYGLSSEYCRIAVRERSDNVLLLEALKEILL